MLKRKRQIRFPVPDDRDAINEARRLIRAAGAQAGRSVQTHYVRSAGVMFGIVPLNAIEERLEGGRLVGALEDAYRAPGK